MCQPSDMRLLWTYWYYDHEQQHGHAETYHFYVDDRLTRGDLDRTEYWEPGPDDDPPIERYVCHCCGREFSWTGEAYHHLGSHEPREAGTSDLDGFRPRF